MKRTALFVFFCVSLQAAPCLGQANAASADANTNAWGAITNNARLSLALVARDEGFKTNQPIEVRLSMENLSSDRVISLYERAGGRVDSAFQIEIESPSGKNISPVPDPVPRGSGMLATIKPKETHERRIRLTDPVKFDEIGVYTVVAKQNIGSADNPCWVVSNQLKISIVPGEWKPDGTNAPPSGF